MAKLFVLYTGGTIGMRATDPNDPDSALIPQPLAHVLAQIPKALLAVYQLDFASLAQPLDSSAMTPADWQTIAAKLAAVYADYDGFVVLHGTDTLAYTATALSFMLENFNKPLVLTGSQLPLGLPNSDALANLQAALTVATWALSEVVIVFVGKILRACRSRKQDTLAFDAFRSPHFPKLGTLVTGLDSSLCRPASQAAFCLRPQFNSAILHCVLTPNLSLEHWQHLLDSPHLAGLLLQSYGAGNAPDQARFLRPLQRAIARGLVVINSSQCPDGSVDMETYATGRALLDCGVLSAFDMTHEAALIKLMWLLAQEHVDMSAWGLSLRGELSCA